MSLGQKLAEDTGKTTGVTVRSLGPEGVAQEFNYVAEVKGSGGRFPDGRLLGTAHAVQGTNGALTLRENIGVFTTTDGESIPFRAVGVSKRAGGGLRVVQFFAFSGASGSRHSWMNDTLFLRDAEFSPETGEFKGTTYEWK